MANKELSKDTQEALLQTLKNRFEQHAHRHEGIEWTQVEKKLGGNPKKLWSLNEMERTEGEPDVVAYEAGEFIFYDCAPESPKGRRKVCYDRAALEARKKYKPETSAMDMAEKMGIDMLDEGQYRYLQTLDVFDKKTSSWILTPQKVRHLGGALFCDYRYDTVFTYHNGADSYYGARGFRGVLKV